MKKKLLVFMVTLALLLGPYPAIPQCIVPPNGAVVKTTSYTALAADTGKHIVMNCSSACTLTLPSTPQSPVWAIFVSSIGSTAAQVSPNGLTLDGSASTITLNGDLASGMWIDTDNVNYFSARGNIGVSVLTAAAALTSGNLVKAAASDRTTVDSGIAAANVPTAASNAAAANQVAFAGGANKTLAFFDFAHPLYIPAANNVNGVGGIGWTCPNATPAVLLRAGTNNKDALLSPWGASDVCYIKVKITKDVVTTASFDISIDLTSTDTTSGHTIIMQAATAFYKGDGTTTDDVAFNTAQAFSTITLNATANQMWTATLTGLTTTGIAAPSTMVVKILRTTDTATNVGVYAATIDIPRRPVVQAN